MHTLFHAMQMFSTCTFARSERCRPPSAAQSHLVVLKRMQSYQSVTLPVSSRPDVSPLRNTHLTSDLIDTLPLKYYKHNVEFLI